MKGNRVSDKQTDLPIFGVGPLYVLSCLLLMIIGLVFHHQGHLRRGEMEGGKVIFGILGIFSILLGIWLWIHSVIIQSVSKEISQGKLVTTGVYGIVRNPIYSAFLFIFTGVLLFFSNYLLLLLPVIYWVFLTVLMKCTEEVWLKERFGDAYEEYCKRVNRVIPWFRKD